MQYTMSKYQILVLIILCSMTIDAQELLRIPTSQLKTATMVSPRAHLGLPERAERSGAPLKRSFLSQESIVGSTIYDLQTNSSMQSRLLVNESGYKAAVWMLSNSTDEEALDRGTGFNDFVDGSWDFVPNSSNPQTRLESERVGWPSLIQLADGSLHITTHSADNQLITSIRAAGSTEWMESQFPNSTPNGLLWPRTAAGGIDGNTIHLLAVATPSTLDGAVYEGVDGHLLYSRSLDGGNTWDKIDVIIPGLDQSSYSAIDGDSYALAARGTTVAVAVFGTWSDVTFYKSYDNGDTWEKTVILDFPLDHYKSDQGYGVDDIPDDPEAPDSLAIYTSDGSGGVAIDVDGLAHVVYADSYVQDDDLTDDQRSFYPGWSGISYWNETMLVPQLIGGLLDYNGNDSIDIQAGSIPRYGNGTSTSMPVITTDDKGGVYVIYSAITEGFFNELDQQNYRHLIAVKSVDGGQQWGNPYDMINPELTDPEVYEFVEAVYPSASKLVNDTVHVLYHQDFFPGNRTNDEGDPSAEIFVVYSGVPTDFIPEFILTAVGELNNLEFSVFPNPTGGRVKVALGEQTSSKDVRIGLYSLQGQLLLERRGGMANLELDLGGVVPGLYLIKVTGQKKSGVKRLVRM